MSSTSDKGIPLAQSAAEWYRLECDRLRTELVDWGERNGAVSAMVNEMLFASVMRECNYLRTAREKP